LSLKAAYKSTEVSRGVLCPPKIALNVDMCLLQVFLWPVAAIVLVVPFAVLAGFNPSRFTLNIYFG
jgi:hypothetical protein